MHKHFRMLAISEHLISQGYVAPNDQHTRIPGIWKKLGALYNLAGLDERVRDRITNPHIDGDESTKLLTCCSVQEASFATDGSGDLEPAQEPYCPFQLPYDEYGEMMFERRLAPEGSSSPPMSLAGGSGRASTVADTDGKRSDHFIQYYRLNITEKANKT